jgi:hypothetical protein
MLFQGIVVAPGVNFIHALKGVDKKINSYNPRSEGRGNTSMKGTPTLY